MCNPVYQGHSRDPCPFKSHFARLRLPPHFQPMDSSALFSDDDYDVISNPSHDGPPENSFNAQEWLRSSSLPHELPPFVDAQDRFETTRWTPDEVQAFIRKQIDTARSLENRKVRVYVDGIFDAFGVG